MNGPSREEMHAKIAAASAETTAQIVKLDSKMDRMIAEMHRALAEARAETHKALADQLKWIVGLLCLMIALSTSMLGLMMRGYVDDAVRKALDEKIQVQSSNQGQSK